MIYGISDLHLDFTKEKPMDIFGSNWKNHEDQIKKNWENTIKSNDIVLLSGDISWGLKLSDAIKDLQFIEKLPGIKILSKGNHDYWWNSLNKINSLNLKDMYFIQNNSFVFGNNIFSATRGWSNVDLKKSSSVEDIKIYKRELIRLELSLKDANTKINNKNYKKICMLHYPPFNRNGSPNDFVDLLKEYNIDICVYGHLHSSGHKFVREGIIENIEFHCISSDFINFIPKKIISR